MNSISSIFSLSYKPYKCAACGHETQIQTNHYGECYSLGNYNRCPKCGPLPPDKRNPQAVVYPITRWQCVAVKPRAKRAKLPKPV